MCRQLHGVMGKSRGMSAWHRGLRASRRSSLCCADSRTTRRVNPVAWDRGTVFVQCAGCKAWHNIRDEMGLIEEVHFASDSSGSESDGGG